MTLAPRPVNIKTATAVHVLCTQPADTAVAAVAGSPYGEVYCAALLQKALLQVCCRHGGAQQVLRHKHLQAQQSSKTPQNLTETSS
jgi:hypothetical protein